MLFAKNRFTGKWSLLGIINSITPTVSSLKYAHETTTYWYSFSSSRCSLHGGGNYYSDIPKPIPFGNTNELRLVCPD